jgi:hypothetical protein
MAEWTAAVTTPPTVPITTMTSDEDAYEFVTFWKKTEALVVFHKPKNCPLVALDGSQLCKHFFEWGYEA